MSEKLLIVEDDAFVRGLLGALLESKGYQIVEASTGKEMLAALAQDRFDLVLLDLGLPDEDGLVLLRQIRTKSNIPVIVLTSRFSVEDRVQALEIGADDFLTKPADHREIALRISRLLGRAVQLPSHQVKVAGRTLDTEARTVTDKSSQLIDLTRSEFDMLSCFFNAPNRVLSREVLLDGISRGDDPPFDRAIDVLISRLRKKVELDPKYPKLIVTVPGVGYRLVSAD